MKVNPEKLIQFYYWIFERHAIWRRRFVDLAPPPWTDDPYLRDFKFTNAFRELDRGTLWFLEHVALPCCAEHEGKDFLTFLTDYVWRSSVYRLLNRIETFEEVPLPAYKDFKKTRVPFEKSLRVIKDRGQSVMTNAHLTVPCPKGVDKIGGYMMTIVELHDKLPGMIDKICAVARASPNSPMGAHSVHAILQTPKRLGHFTAYEIYCDLCYVGALPYTEDTWANAGPGAQKGLKLIFGEKFNDWMTGMCWLQERLPVMAGLMRPDFVPHTGLAPSPTLRVIEHSLCEVGKYDRLKSGTGKTRMIFKPGVTTFTPEEGHYDYVARLHRLTRRIVMCQTLHSGLSAPGEP